MVELMVVIVIIGMLAGLVAVNVLGSLEDANRGAAQAQISNFDNALTMYKLKHKKLPASLEGLINVPSGEPFLKSSTVPKDPWGKDYIYKAPGSNGRRYDIVSYGADGTQGGEGENADVESWNLQGDS
jgi:general secretion pathway protein G